MNLAKLELPEQVAAIQPYIIICEGEDFAYSIVGAVESVEVGIELIYGHYAKVCDDLRDGIDRHRPDRYIFNRRPKGSDGFDNYESYFTMHVADM